MGTIQNEQKIKLLSMTDFVLEQIKKLKSSEINILQFRNSIENYANFLKQHLTLGMFIPCDDNGNVLEEPKRDKYPNEIYFITDLQQYQQAKEVCMFEGFKIIDMHIENQTWKNVISDEILINIFWFSKEYKKWELSKGIKIIEDLSKYNHLILTPTAIKQLEL